MVPICTFFFYLNAINKRGSRLVGEMIILRLIPPPHRWQVLIDPAEHKDGSGGPADLKELKDLVFPREPSEAGRRQPEGPEPQTAVVVRMIAARHLRPPQSGPQPGLGRRSPQSIPRSS